MATECTYPGKRIVRVQRGESVGSEVSSSGGSEERDSGSSRPVSCVASTTCSLKLPRLNVRVPVPDKGAPHLPPGLEHRSRKRLAHTSLKRGEPCGWCRRPCGGSWLMGYDMLHCSQACLRATERSVDGKDDNWDPAKHFLLEIPGGDCIDMESES